MTGILICLLYVPVLAGEVASRPVEEMREALFAGLALRPGMVVADIGIGGGWFTSRAAQAVGPSGVVYGTDIDAESIASMQRALPNLGAAAGRIELHVCNGERDTALDSVPDNQVDVILIVDSLCFNAHVSRQDNLTYLRRFLRILRPGGRLVHHMDCHCDVAPEDVVTLFVDAGFSPPIETIQVPHAAEANGQCETEAARRRHAFVGVFRKPGSTTELGRASDAAAP